MSQDTRPRAREGLLASDHSKRGRRFVILVDPETHDATLLEPWEHALLVLCDGTRSPAALVELLAPEVDGQEIDLDVVWRCLKFFERQGLIGKAGLRASDAPPPGPVTLTTLQRAYAEWHKTPDDPASTGLPPPIPRTSPKIAAGLDPTIATKKAQDAGKSMLTGVHSLLDAVASDEGDADEAMPDLLAALDDAVAEASRVDQSERAKKEIRRAGVEVAEAESRPRTSGVFAPPAGGVLVADELTADMPSGGPAAQVTRVAPPATRPAQGGQKTHAIPGLPKRAAKASDAPASSRKPDPARKVDAPKKPDAARKPHEAAQHLDDPGRRAAGGATEPTMRLADLLATDATEPATITLQPASPGGVRLRDEETPLIGAPRAKTADLRTQLGPMLKKR